MPPQKKQKPEGLYSQALAQDFSAVKQEVKKTPAFLSLTKSLAKSFGEVKGKKFSEEQIDLFNFLGWQITPEEFYGAYSAILKLGLVFGIIVGGLLFFALGDSVDLLIKIAPGLLIILAGFGASFFYLHYPQQAANKEKMLSLAYIPEIVNYLTMSLRLTPNLEKAVEFAANHGRGKIAEDLKKIVWDVQIGKFLSVEEALDDLAYKWGAYNDDFKHALMLIRASVLEASRAEREKILEKASADVLEGSKEKMDMYARNLHQPTVYLYYFGILLPLLLAVILPIGASMTGQQLAKPEYLFVGYNLLIPLMVFVFGLSILGSRPPTYTPPEIPANYPGLKKQNGLKLLAVFAFLGLLAAGFYTDQGVLEDSANEFLIPANEWLKEFSYNSFGSEISLVGEEGLAITGTLGAIPSYANMDEEVAKLPHFAFFYDEYDVFVGQFTLFGFLIGTALFISLWLKATYSERKRVQDEIRSMENEFKDALYVLASRMGENKPLEEALRSAVQFLPKSPVANQVFRRVLENITTMGMTLDAAIFDKTFGAVKLLPSRTIQSGMRFLCDSVELGVNVASKSLIALAIQLRDMQKIDESLKKLLEDVTTMLKTMSTFVAPIVLAVVSAMQRMIINSISSNASSAESQQQLQGVQGFQINNLFSNPDVAQSSADPATFIAIMGIYVIEVVVLLTYFNAQIEDSNNKLHTYTSIANTLPIAVVLYCVVVYFASTAIGAPS